MKRLYWIIIQLVTVPCENRVENLLLNSISNKIIVNNNLEELLYLMLLDLNQRIEKKLGTELFDIIKPDINDHHEIYTPASNSFYKPYALGLFVVIILGSFCFVYKYFSGLNKKNKKPSQQQKEIYDNEQQEREKTVNDNKQNKKILEKDIKTKDDQEFVYIEQDHKSAHIAQDHQESGYKPPEKPVIQPELNLEKEDDSSALLQNESENQQNPKKYYLIREYPYKYFFLEEKNGIYVKKTSPLFNFVTFAYSELDDFYDQTKLGAEKVEELKIKKKPYPDILIDYEMMLSIPKNNYLFGFNSFFYLETLDTVLYSEVPEFNNLMFNRNTWTYMIGFFRNIIKKEIKIKKPKDPISFVQTIVEVSPKIEQLKHYMQYCFNEHGKIYLVLEYRGYKKAESYSVHILDCLFSIPQFRKEYGENFPSPEIKVETKIYSPINIDKHMYDQIENLSKNLFLFKDPLLVFDFGDGIETTYFREFETKKTKILEKKQLIGSGYDLSETIRVLSKTVLDQIITNIANIFKSKNEIDVLISAIKYYPTTEQISFASYYLNPKKHLIFIFEKIFGFPKINCAIGIFVAEFLKIIKSKKPNLNLEIKWQEEKFVDKPDIDGCSFVETKNILLLEDIIGDRFLLNKDGQEKWWLLSPLLTEDYSYYARNTLVLMEDPDNEFLTFLQNKQEEHINKNLEILDDIGSEIDMIQLGFIISKILLPIPKREEIQAEYRKSLCNRGSKQESPSKVEFWTVLYNPKADRKEINQ